MHCQMSHACTGPQLTPSLRCSPHIRSFHERMAVGGAPIPGAELDALVARHAGAIEAAAEREGGALSHFEIVTALAFKHFQEQQVWVGGRACAWGLGVSWAAPLSEGARRKWFQNFQ